MQHPECDDLALLALDESLGSGVDAHVAGCPRCYAEVAAFRTTVGLAALSNYGENAPHPRESVWQAIADELGLDPAATAGNLTTTTQEPGQGDTVAPAGHTVPFRAKGPSAPLPEGRAHRNGSNGRLTSVSDTGTDLPVTDRPRRPGGGREAGSSRRWTRWASPVAAVLIGIAVGAGAVVIGQNRGSDVTVEAVAPLKGVPGGPLTAEQQRQLGRAELLTAPSSTQVKVDAPDLPATSTHAYEVWLFGNDGRMVSLGILSNGGGTFTVPTGISTREYRTVDVSDQPPNGNPAHSGISLVRGSFS